MRPIRTDLAVEAFEGSGSDAIPGVTVTRWSVDGVGITEVTVEDNSAASTLGKPKGTYLTLDAPLLRERDPDARLAVSSLLGEELARLLPDRSPEDTVLVVGLGNRGITPDSLGPAAIDRTLATRHLLAGPYAPADLSSVCAIAPGVLGVTGIETQELVEGLVEKLRPACLICVDSLAARAVARLGSTLQLSDAGIQPGAGVGNHRTPLTQSRLGVPVISVGMPTVVYAATLARDAFAWLNLQNGDDDPHEEALADMENALLRGDIGEMIVTPREVDAMVQDAAGIIASAINRALHPGLGDRELAAMMD